MILTTTNSIDGASITEYLGPVSAHVVLGTNIFSDIAAGWRDVFGGRSQSYQKQLQRLSEVVLQELQQKAKALRADAVVGLKVDYSDVSGGGKMTMLMVVATGTAVVTDATRSTSTADFRRIVDKEAVEQMIAQERTIQNFRMQKYASENELMKLTQTRAHEAWDDVVERFHDTINHPGSHIANYFAMCVEERGYQWALETVMSLPFGPFLKNALTNVASLDDFRLADLTTYVGREDVDEQKIFNLIDLGQSIYSSSDIRPLRLLSSTISEAYPDKSILVEEKTFTRKIKAVRKCHCGGTIDDIGRRCAKCGLNQWGLTGGEYSPEWATQQLETIVRVLNRAFSKTT